MRLERCRDQASRTLEEFYEEVAGHSHPVDQGIGKGMLSLLARLRALDDPRQVWGLTSHYHLVLLAEDTYKSPWYVMICAVDEQRFELVIQPEEGEGVRVPAASLDQAVAVILDAMDRSGGWNRRA